MTAVAHRRRDDLGTASRILDVAEGLVQTRGFNGFSYADIATQLQMTKAALHYHYAGKADLGAALIARYASRFAEALAAIDAGGGPALRKLAGYAGLYLRVLSENKMCLCGMLAAEYQTLPQPMRDAVIRFFDDNEAWLQAILEEGRRSGGLQFGGGSRDAARMIVGTLEGAMLIARSYGDPARLRAAADHLLASLAQATATSDPAPTAQVQAHPA
jgi:TetR/AcrR family transcriptional regulator, transcriptional repressor for nem operon